MMNNNNYDYDYRAAVLADVKDYIENEISLADWIGDREGLEDKLNDLLWTADSVTGNASGSYYCNTYRAEMALAHNWELLTEAADAFGIDPVISCGYEHGAEYWDCTIRCHLLPEMIGRALDDLENAGFFDDPEEEAAEA